MKSNDLEVICKEGLIELIELILKNKNKMIHKPNIKWTQFDDEEIINNHNIIGYISYFWSLKDRKLIYYLYSIEIREEYRNTITFKILFNTLKTEFEYLINDYGKENI